MGIKEKKKYHVYMWKKLKKTEPNYYIHLTLKSSICIWRFKLSTKILFWISLRFGFYFYFYGLFEICCFKTFFFFFLVNQDHNIKTKQEQVYYKKKPPYQQKGGQPPQVVGTKKKKKLEMELPPNLASVIYVNYVFFY